MTPDPRTTATRAALVRGAAQCLREKGFARTTARDIVAAAGVNLGAIGYHFGSTDAVLAEAVASVFREWLFRVRPTVTDLASKGASFEELLLGVAREGAAVFPDGRKDAAAFLEGVALAERSDALRDQMAADYEQLRHLAAGLIEMAVGDDVADDERRGLASIFIALDAGLMIQALLDPARAPRAEEIVAALRVLSRLMTLDPDRQP